MHLETLGHGCGAGHAASRLWGQAPHIKSMGSGTPSPSSRVIRLWALGQACQVLTTDPHVQALHIKAAGTGCSASRRGCWALSVKAAGARCSASRRLGLVAPGQGSSCWALHVKATGTVVRGCQFRYVGCGVRAMRPGRWVTVARQHLHICGFRAVGQGHSLSRPHLEKEIQVLQNGVLSKLKL